MGEAARDEAAVSKAAVEAAAVEAAVAAQIQAEDEAVKNVNGSAQVSASGEGKKRRKPKKKGPNYNQIHQKPLPLDAHPLPTFHPTNPLSMLQLAYAYLSQLWAPPQSHPSKPYIGYLSKESRSVHVTDPVHVRALWEMGFFGKGILSRSEPSWLDREKARLKAKRAGGGGTAEEATNARREKRRLFKLERARLEAEKIERQRLVEEGKLDPSALEDAATDAATDAGSVPNSTGAEAASQGTVGTISDAKIDPGELSEDEEDIEEDIIVNQEFLQLTLEEAFFLKYALGVLEVQHGPDRERFIPSYYLLLDCAGYGFFPPRKGFEVQPDDPFMLNYVVYHHFRSLGWVVRPGVKFSVDYLLYERGPVFNHANFAVIIMPSYSHPYWSSAEGQSRRRIKEDQQKNWWWIHCINRVQSAVLKHLILCYVDIPPPGAEQKGTVNVGKLLGGYKVREFAIKRWVGNRSRD